MSSAFDVVNGMVIPVIDNLIADFMVLFIGVMGYRFLNPRSRLLAEFSKNKTPWLAAWVPAGTRPDEWVTELLMIRVSLLRQHIRFQSFPIKSDNGARLRKGDDALPKYHWYANGNLFESEGVIFGPWKSMLQPAKYSGLIWLDINLLTRLVGEFKSSIVGESDPARPLFICSNIGEMTDLLNQQIVDPLIRAKIIDSFQALIDENK